MLKIRAFRAVNDQDSCKLFAGGHAKVLLDYGVSKVTSANNEWFHNPNVYVVIVQEEDGEVVGGERIHIVHKDFPLPIENAITIVDKKVHQLVAVNAQKGLTGELCGLWNSKSIAGKGVSVLLTKLGVAMGKILKMNSLFVLCAPYTVEMCQRAGFEIETSIGNNGTFIYPKLDLIATSLCIKDMVDLKNADEAFRKEIFSFVDNPVSTFIENGPKGEFEIAYDLALKVN